MPKRSRDDDDELSSLMGKTSLQPLRRAPRRSARQVADTMREEEQRSKRRRQSAREIKKEQEREMDELAHTLANFSMRIKRKKSGRKSKGRKSGRKSKGRKSGRKSTRKYSYARYGKQRASKRKLKKSRRTHRKVERSNRMKRGCSPQSTSKYRSRSSPPYPANNCCGATKKGNDGKTYKSVKASNGICRWVKK